MEQNKNIQLQDFLDVNKQDKEGNTILMNMTCVSLGMTKFLLVSGANPNLVNNEGDNILMDICKNVDITSCNMQKIDKLIEIYVKYNINLNLQNNKGHTAIMMLCNKITEQNIGNFIEILKKYDFDVNLESETGYTLAFHCLNDITPRTCEIIELLLKKGIDVNKQNKKHGWTLLMSACNDIDVEGSLGIINILLENDADPNLFENENEHHFTPLMFICDNNANYTYNAIAIEYLINYGANVNLKNKYNKSAIDIFIEKTTSGRNSDTFKNILQILIGNGAKVDNKYLRQYPCIVDIVLEQSQKMILQKNERIKELESAFKYIPGNEGMLEAKKEFEEHSQKQPENILEKDEKIKDLGSELKYIPENDEMSEAKKEFEEHSQKQREKMREKN